MAKIATSDIRDELLSPLVVSDDLAEVDQYLSDLAATLEVVEADIPSVLPYRAKQLLVAKCCEIVAKRKAGFSPASYTGNDGADAYELKRRIYAADVKRLELLIDKKALTGAAPAAAAGHYSFTIVRA